MLLSSQIVCALEQDDAARKQRLAFKLEQVVAFMSLESWGLHFPGCTGKRPHQKPSRAWAKTCPPPPPSSPLLLLLRLPIMWLPRSAFQRWFLPRPSRSCFLQPEKIFFFSSSTLLHRLVSPKHTWRVVPGLKAWDPSPSPPRHGVASWPYWRSAAPSSADRNEKKGENRLFTLPSRIYTDR